MMTATGLSAPNPENVSVECKRGPARNGQGLSCPYQESRGYSRILRKTLYDNRHDNHADQCLG